MSTIHFIGLFISIALSLSAHAAPNADEGPTFLNGFWRGRGAVNRDGGVTQCFYVLTEFRVANNSYDNTGFKRKCYSPKGQIAADTGTDTATDTDTARSKVNSAEIVIENLPDIAVTAREGKLTMGAQVIGTYTKDTVDVRFEVPSPEDAKNTWIWHGRFSLVNDTIVFQEDSVTLGPDKNVKKYEMTYAGVMERASGSPEELTKELADPN